MKEVLCMAKQFFKEFIEVKNIIERDKELDDYRSYSENNDICFEAVSKYLYSYKWCRSDREKILLQTAESYKRGEVIASENNIQYNSFRSMSSRVSNRLYKELGTDFKKVILGNNKKEQDKLITYCIMRVDEFQILNSYPEFLVSHIKAISSEQDIKIDDSFKIGMKDWVILKFLADYDIEMIMKAASILNKERLAMFYTILTDKKYFKERADVLSVINHFKKQITISNMQAETDIASKQGVLISKKEYEEFMRYKKTQS